MAATVGVLHLCKDRYCFTTEQKSNDIRFSKISWFFLEKTESDTESQLNK